MAAARERIAVEIGLCATSTMDRVDLYGCIGSCLYVHE